MRGKPKRWAHSPPRSARLQSRAVIPKGRGRPRRWACWNAQCGVRPRPDLPGYSQEQWLSEVSGSRIAGPAGTHSAGCGPDCGSLRLHVALTLLAPNPALRPTGQEEGRLTVLLEHLLFFKRNQKSGVICEILTIFKFLAANLKLFLKHSPSQSLWARFFSL